MTDDWKLTADQAVRLLRTKAAELTTWVGPRLGGPGTTELDWLVADVALIAGLLADHIAGCER